jgi:hypothetical protein
MVMSPRFISNIALGLAGAFVVVASQAFSSGVTGWIALGVGVGALVVVGAAQFVGSRGLTQRALDGVTALLAVWTVVASVIFTGTTLTWLSLGEGLGFVVLALAGLVAHELSTERIVHTFEEVLIEARERGRGEQFSAAG